MNVANYVRSVRLRLGLTQQALANKLKKSRWSVTNYELGRALPPGDVLLQIQAFELSLDPPAKSKIHNTFFHPVRSG